MCVVKTNTYFYVLANCGAPTYTVDVDQSCIELGGVIPPNPTTEGATLAFSCASLLIRTKAPFDYCPVKRCQNDGLWSDAKMSCGAGKWTIGTRRLSRHLSLIKLIKGKVGSIIFHPSFHLLMPNLPK